MSKSVVMYDYDDNQVFPVTTSENVYVGAGVTLKEHLENLDGDGEVIVDKELSETSENPVQNKVVTERMNDINRNLYVGVGSLDSDNLAINLTISNYSGYKNGTRFVGVFPGTITMGLQCSFMVNGSLVGEPNTLNPRVIEKNSIVVFELITINGVPRVRYSDQSFLDSISNLEIETDNKLESLQTETDNKLEELETDFDTKLTNVNNNATRALNIALDNFKQIVRKVYYGIGEYDEESQILNVNIPDYDGYTASTLVFAEFKTEVSFESNAMLTINGSGVGEPGTLSPRHIPAGSIVAIECKTVSGVPRFEFLDDFDRLDYFEQKIFEFDKTHDELDDKMNTVINPNFINESTNNSCPFSLHNELASFKDSGYIQQTGTPKPTSPIAIVGVGNENLLNPSLETNTTNDISCVKNENATYTLNGIASEDTSFVLSTIDTIFANILKTRPLKLLGGKGESPKLTFELWDINMEKITTYTDRGMGAVVYPNKDIAYARVSMVISKGYKCNNVVVKPMITLDKEASINKFVPFTNGKYAIPITICGGNLCSCNQAERDKQGLLIEKSKLYLKANKTYTIQCDNMESASGKDVNLLFLNTHSVNSGYMTVSPNDLVNGTIVFTPTVDIYGFTIIIQEAVTITNLQIHEGTTRRPYESHTEISTIIPIDEPLYDGDYIEIFADGSGEIVRKYKTFDITRWSWFTNVLTTTKEARYPKPSDAKLNGNIYCTIAKKVDQTWDIDEVGIMTYGGDNYNEICVRIPFDAGDTDYLCTVVYELDEPIREPLTAEQVNAFKKLHTFNGTTHIAVDGNVTVRYYCNKVGLLEQEVKELKTIVSSLITTNVEG